MIECGVEVVFVCLGYVVDGDLVECVILGGVGGGVDGVIVLVGDLFCEMFVCFGGVGE